VADVHGNAGIPGVELVSNFPFNDHDEDEDLDISDALTGKAPKLAALLTGNQSESVAALLKGGYEHLGTFRSNDGNRMLELLGRGFDTSVWAVSLAGPQYEAPSRRAKITDDSCDGVSYRVDEFPDCCAAEVYELPTDKELFTQRDDEEEILETEKSLTLTALDPEAQSISLSLALKDGFKPVARYKHNKKTYVLLAHGLLKPKKARKKF